MAGRVGTHPSAELLHALGLGKLDDAQVGTVMEHLETCVGCRMVVTGQTGDDFLARLRDAHSATRSPATAQSLAGASRNTPPPSGHQLPAIDNLLPELAANQQYEVVRELGRGGMGVVYLARNRLLARQEVLKVVNQDILSRSGGKERFLREIQSAAQLSHPNVVTAYSALQLGEMLVFAMEYVEGEDLAKVVKARGPLPVANACYYAHQVALGLQHACEKNMVHRDIKPQNLILARHGKKHIVKILDFGLAKVLCEKGEKSALTGTGKMLGTPDYIAPEQSLDATRADIRADLYSLGCTLYFLLTGSAPFRGKTVFAILQAHHTEQAESLHQVRQEVPPALAAVVAKLMAKEPAQRYQKPAEVARALAPFLKTPVLKALPAGLSPAEGTSRPGAMIPPDQITTGLVKPLGQETVLPGPDNWETMFEGSGPIIQGKNKTGGKPTPSPKGKTTKWRIWLGISLGKLRLGLGISVGALLLAVLGGLWAVGFFRMQTNDDHQVALVNKPDAEVNGDGAKNQMPSGAQKENPPQKLAPGSIGDTRPREKSVKPKTQKSDINPLVSGQEDLEKALPLAERVALLRTKLLDEGAETRRKAAASVASLGENGRMLFRELVICLGREDNDGETRKNIVTALVSLVGPQDKTAVSALTQALNDPDIEIKLNAALALSNIGGQDAGPAVPVLVDVIQGRNLKLRRLAAAAIKNIGKYGREALPALRDALGDPDEELRTIAAVALAGLGEAAAPAVRDLVRHLADPFESPRVRVETAVALSRIGPVPDAVEAVPTLLKVLEDPANDSKVRERTMWALRVHEGKLRTLNVLPTFIKILSQPKNQGSRMLRYDCAYLLGLFLQSETPAEATDVLLEFLKDTTVLIYKGTEVGVGGASAESKVGKTKIEEKGYGDGRLMAIDALDHIGRKRVLDRRDIVEQLEAIADNPQTLADLRQKTQELLRKLKR